MIGIGAAVALGVGVTYIAKKVDEYQEKMLNTLADRMIDLDKEMGEFAAKQEEGLFERMGIQLGNLSALGQARVASEEAFEQFGQDKEKFIRGAEIAYETIITNFSNEDTKPPSNQPQACNIKLTPPSKAAFNVLAAS